MGTINKLNFEPLPGLGSKHFQTIIASYLPAGEAPPSKNRLIELEQDDYLSCEISTPTIWKKTDQTIVLIHGMGGSHLSNTLIRMARKLYAIGSKVVRVNLRGCGSGEGLSKLPYSACTSSDVFKVLQTLKKENPSSDISIIGFSLGGSIVLKLAGELGFDAGKFVKRFIAICAPLDLVQSASCIQEKGNRLYHAYYLKKICEQAREWLPKIPHSLYEFDNLVTAPLWGYKGADEYYRGCSSIRFLPSIQQSTHLLFAKDDPFIFLDRLQEVSLPDAVQVWTTDKGGHMGFLGKNPEAKSPYWMDHLLLNWISDDFSSNRKAS